jgi:cell division protein FtsB
VKVRTKIASAARAFLPGVLLALIVLAGAIAMHLPATARRNAQLTEMVTRLSAEVSRLSQEQAMPSVVVGGHPQSNSNNKPLY